MIEIIDKFNKILNGKEVVINLNLEDLENEVYMNERKAKPVKPK